MATRPRQVERTKTWILDAFATLLSHNSYDKIRISEICLQADVSRQSLYRLYGDKDGVLKAYFDRVFDEFEESALHQDGTDRARLYRSLFAAFDHHRDEMKSLSEPKTRAILFEALWSYQARLQEYADIDERTRSGETLRDSYVIKYQSGGIAALVMEWVSQGMDMEPEHIGNLVAEIADAFRDDRDFLPTILLARHG